MAETWIDRWTMIEHRYDCVVKECWRGHPSDDGSVHFSGMRCKSEIEALAIDLWSLKDWLVNDPTSPLDLDTVNDFVESGAGYHVRGCADLATRLKHHSVDHWRRHLMELHRVDEFPDGEPPIIFEARKVIFEDEEPAERKQRAKAGDPRPVSGSSDRYPDAVELLRRAVAGWRSFLQQHDLLLDR